MKKKHFLTLALVIAALSRVSFSLPAGEVDLKAANGLEFHAHQVTDFHKLSKMDAHTIVYTHPDLIHKANEAQLASLKEKTVVLEPVSIKSPLSPIDYEALGRKLSQAKPASIQVKIPSKDALPLMKGMLSAPHTESNETPIRVTFPEMTAAEKEAFKKNLSALTVIRPTEDKEGAHFVTSDKQQQFTIPDLSYNDI